MTAATEAREEERAEFERVIRHIGRTLGTFSSNDTRPLLEGVVAPKRIGRLFPRRQAVGAAHRAGRVRASPAQPLKEWRSLDCHLQVGRCGMSAVVQLRLAERMAARNWLARAAGGEGE